MEQSREKINGAYIVSDAGDTMWMRYIYNHVRCVPNINLGKAKCTLDMLHLNWCHKWVGCQQVILAGFRA